MTKMTKSRIKLSYSELIRIPTFEERYSYLRLGGILGDSTFGFDRYINQMLYRSPEWRHVRNEVIVRDDGCDLGISDRSIGTNIIVHHMNPLTIDDIISGDPDVFNPEFLICASHATHNAIHYGDDTLLVKELTERKPGDTCPWRR